MMENRIILKKDEGREESEKAKVMMVMN